MARRERITIREPHERVTVDAVGHFLLFLPVSRRSDEARLLVDCDNAPRLDTPGEWRRERVQEGFQHWEMLLKFACHEQKFRELRTEWWERRRHSLLDRPKDRKNK